MASSTVAFVALMMMLMTPPTITFAKDFIVGDEAGWTVGFNYQTWAATKEFHIGDRLVFQYPAGAHNVYKVNGTDFTNCNLPAQGQPLRGGKDTVILSTLGNKWYICGVENHCSRGQKLKITVIPNAQAPSLSPAAPGPRGPLPWIPLVPAPASKAVDYETAA